MPKATPPQTGFNTGEVSPLFYGNFQNPRYKKGLATCLNYIPTLQGPLVRRPGTKFCAAVNTSGVPLNPFIPPVLIPFQFSADQSYILEVGHQYIRFFTNNGQMVTVGTSFQVIGLVPPHNTFYATRANTNPQNLENIISSVSIAPGSPLELPTPYKNVDVANIKFAQNSDTLYLVHPNYPVMKLQRQAQTYWSLFPVYFQDGPYLALNSLKDIGDSVSITLTPQAASTFTEVVTGPAATITGAITDPGGSGQIQLTTSAAHGFGNGKKVFVNGIVGTTEANNFDKLTSPLYDTHPAFWVVQATTPTTLLLLGSTFTNAWISGGQVFPALFSDSATAVKNATTIPDIGRTIALLIGGVRYWGVLNGLNTLPVTFNNASRAYVVTGGTSPENQIAFPSATTATGWFLGVWSGNQGATFVGSGYPGAVCFHQNRLAFAGAVNYPQEVDFSNTGSFEVFSPSDYLTLNVKDNNSLQFNLNSDDANVLRWLASTQQGLLAGSYVSEWSITPSSNAEALTPTNFNAQQSSFFGVSNTAPAKIGNAVVYIQRAQRKVRELTFFFQAGTFRSIDLTEICEHITLPKINQIAVQKETQPLVWGVRSDGNLVTLVYNRDDVSLSAGWTRHILGGQSDSGGTNPVVNAIASIPAPDLTFDQIWMVVKRFINGATVYNVEYMTKIYDDSFTQEDAYHLDGGATFDNPKTITGITTAATAVVTAAAHGFNNGDAVKITSVVGMNQSTTDINGVVTTVNLVNEKTFVVANKTANTFELNDFNSAPISSVGFGAYISGGQARKLVTTISGVTWLQNEKVSVLTDGGIHPDVVVSNAGVITLNYPAAKVQFGYPYKSQGQLLRVDAGAADGTSIGKTRRTARVAVQLHTTGDLKLGTDFNNLLPVALAQADQNNADNAVPLFSGMIREGLESAYDFESQPCFEQSSPLPGVIQSITSFMEEFDV